VACLAPRDLVYYGLPVRRVALESGPPCVCGIKLGVDLLMRLLDWHAPILREFLHLPLVQQASVQVDQTLELGCLGLG